MHDTTGFFKKQPPAHTWFYGAVRNALPPKSMLGTPGVHDGLQKSNHFSNTGLPLSPSSTLSWGCMGCCNSTSWCRCSCFFEEPDKICVSNTCKDMAYTHDIMFVSRKRIYIYMHIYIPYLYESVERGESETRGFLEGPSSWGRLDPLQRNDPMNSGS